MPEIEKPPLVSGADRRHERKRVLFGGRAIYGDGVYSVQCTIRDISEGGARIAVSRGVQLPQNIYFIDLKAGTCHEAEVVWRQDPNVGIRFIRAIDVENPPKELRYLERLYRIARQ